MANIPDPIIKDPAIKSNIILRFSIMIAHIKSARIAVIEDFFIDILSRLYYRTHVGKFSNSIFFPFFGCVNVKR